MKARHHRRDTGDTTAVWPVQRTETWISFSSRHPRAFRYIVPMVKLHGRSMKFHRDIPGESISLRALAEAMKAQGVPTSAISLSRIERGGLQDKPRDFVRAMANALGCSMAVLGRCPVRARK